MSGSSLPSPLCWHFIFLAVFLYATCLHSNALCPIKRSACALLLSCFCCCCCRSRILRAVWSRTRKSAFATLQSPLFLRPPLSKQFQDGNSSANGFFCRAANISSRLSRLNLSAARVTFPNTHSHPGVSHWNWIGS